TVVCLLIAWDVVASPALADDSTDLLARLGPALLPLLDAVLLSLLLNHLLASRSVTSPAAFLTAGVAAWLVADLLFLAPDVDDRLVDAGWLAGSALLALGCWPPRRPPPDVGDDEDDDGRIAIRLAFVGLLPLLVPGSIELWSYLDGRDLNPAPLLLATVVLLALTFLRARQLILSDRGLRSRLRSSERHHRALSDNSADAVLLVDADGTFLEEDPSPALVALVGPWPGAQRSTTPLQWLAPDEVDRAADMLAEVLEHPNRVVVGEVRLAV
ncbi:hypothetical protein B7486_65915, partial [cyanobacterium TDX16]